MVIVIIIFFAEIFATCNVDRRMCIYTFRHMSELLSELNVFLRMSKKCKLHKFKWTNMQR